LIFCKYIQSVTEEEVRAGIVNNPNRETQTFFFSRSYSSPDTSQGDAGLFIDKAGLFHSPPPLLFFPFLFWMISVSLFRFYLLFFSHIWAALVSLAHFSFHFFYHHFPTISSHSPKKD
jgi:hypothetical protein